MLNILYRRKFIIEYVSFQKESRVLYTTNYKHETLVIEKFLPTLELCPNVGENPPKQINVSRKRLQKLYSQISTPYKRLFLVKGKKQIR